MSEIVVGFNGCKAIEVDPSMVASVNAVPNTNRIAITFTGKASQADVVHIDAIHTKGPNGTAVYVQSLINRAANRPNVF